MRFLMARSLAFLVLVLALGACADEPQDKITGTRVPVLTTAAKLTPTIEAATDEPLAIPPTTEVNAWPQAMGRPDAGLGNIALAAKPREVWSANAGAGGDKRTKLLARPIIANGMVFTLDAEAQARAFALKNGETLWTQDLSPEDAEETQFGGGLAYDNGRVYATTGYGEVLALAADTGEVQWRTSARDVLRAAPMLAEGRLYAITLTGELLALNAENGQVLWTHSGITESSAILGGSVPVTSAGVVFAPYSSGDLYAVRAQNGRTIWAQSLAGVASRGAAPAMSDIKASPAIDDNKVYAISSGGRMAAIDIRTGNVAWDADVAGIDTPVLAGEQVFVLADDGAGFGTVVALSASTGAVLRVQPLPRYEDDDSTGTPLRWTGPILAGGLLWLGNNIGELRALAADTLQEVRTIRVGDSISIPPVAAAGLLLVLRDDGTLVALR